MPLYRRVSEAICAAVEGGELAPGEKLPPRLTLARQLGVSPTSVSDACQWLERRGIVAGRRGSGTVIQPDALRRIQGRGARRISTVLVVLEHPYFNQSRDLIYIVAQIIDSLRETLEAAQVHAGPIRVEYTSKLDRACMQRLPADSAVLIKDREHVDAVVVEELVRRNVPVLSFWRSPPYFNVPHVSHDAHASVNLACEHLIDCGYRRIGFIGVKSSEQAWLAVKFLQFTNALHEAGIDFRARDVYAVDHARFGNAYRAAQQIAASEDRPEAIFADTDEKAIEAINAFQHAGLRVPEDIGVIGYTDIPEASRCEPPLTTVRTPRVGIGQRVAQLLLDWPEDAEVPEPGHAALHTIPAELIVRGSTRGTPQSTAMSSASAADSGPAS